MANEPNTPATPSAPAGGQPQISARVVAQYIKDLSFENPNIGKLLQGLNENPNVQINIGVSTQQMGPNLYESSITFKAQTTSKDTTFYDLECVYAGLFQVDSMPAGMLEPFLLVNCPALIFPFLRRIIADLTREGGFPPLLLDPVDFGALYVRQQQEAAAGVAKS